MTDRELRTQNLAVFLIIAAAISISVGSRFDWHDLVTFSLTFGGAGVGILTGQRSNNTLSTKDGGDINVASPDIPNNGK